MKRLVSLGVPEKWAQGLSDRILNISKKHPEEATKIVSTLGRIFPGKGDDDPSLGAERLSSLLYMMEKDPLGPKGLLGGVAYSAIRRADIPTMEVVKALHQITLDSIGDPRITEAAVKGALSILGLKRPSKMNVSKLSRTALLLLLPVYAIKEGLRPPYKEIYPEKVKTHVPHAGLFYTHIEAQRSDEVPRHFLQVVERFWEDPELKLERTLPELSMKIGPYTFTVTRDLSTVTRSLEQFYSCHSPYHPLGRDNVPLIISSPDVHIVTVRNSKGVLVGRFSLYTGKNSVVMGSRIYGPFRAVPNASRYTLEFLKRLGKELGSTPYVPRELVQRGERTTVELTGDTLPTDDFVQLRLGRWVAHSVVRL